MTDNRNKQTFPFSVGANFNPGLTKREYFAGLAMQGMLASGKLYTTLDYDTLGEKAVKFADNLLSQLEDNNESEKQLKS